MTDKQDEKTDKKPDRPGCEHYARKCLFVSPCCKRIYPCRVCHDDKENHEIDRRAVMQIKCAMCDLIQKVQQKCEGCSIVFGSYYCETCRLFDDDDRGQFHCNGCGLCRVGGKEKYFHCEKCDMCLSVKLKGKHMCVEESSRRNCAVCLEDLHTSRSNAHIPPCGHLIHQVCLEQCMKTGNYACPTCAQSLFDMSQAWKQLDVEVANTPMPEEYRNFQVYILCRDCHKESKVLFHVIGLKCKECGSYNTCRAAERDQDDTPQGASGDSTDIVSSDVDMATSTNPTGNPSSGDVEESERNTASEGNEGTNQKPEDIGLD